MLHLIQFTAQMFAKNVVQYTVPRLTQPPILSQKCSDALWLGSSQVWFIPLLDKVVGR